jgi:SAM-dependent methyltransferase
MLAHARRRAPAARFVRADMTRDPLPEGPFDLAVCLFDSLNHVLDIESVARLFRAVYRVLVPGGGFLFDLNTPEGFEHRWRGSFAHVLDDLVVAVRPGWSEERRRGELDVTWFQPSEARVESGDGEPALWRRGDARIVETAHPPERLREALESAGFEQIGTISHPRDPTLPAEIGRTFWLARRPAGSAPSPP